MRHDWPYEFLSRSRDIFLNPYISVHMSLVFSFSNVIMVLLLLSKTVSGSCNTMNGSGLFNLRMHFLYILTPPH